MKTDFTIGDRVRLTTLGASRCLRLAGKMGTIVGGSIYANSVSVRFDGNRSASTLHRDYLEVITKSQDASDQSRSDGIGADSE